MLEHGGGKRTLADNWKGKRFNSPNDLAVHSSGAIYFTDPPYGLPKGADDPTREIDFCGIYRLAASGEVTLLCDTMTRPNGLGFSPDEKTLYVAQSDPAQPIWRAFGVKAEGTHLGTMLTGQATANCGFGEDGRTLFITADSWLCRVRLR